MRRKLVLTRKTAEIVSDIKATMGAPLPPYNFTVIQTLCERYRANAFNDSAAEMFPDVREEFGNAIRDFATARGTSARKARKLAGNAWKWDHAVDRRVWEGSATPYKGRPEVYDREVVRAFADAIARAIGRSHVSWTRGTNDNKSSGAILAVFVAAVQWAICVAWQCSAPPDSELTEVKAEGLLGIIKGTKRPTKYPLEK